MFVTTAHSIAIRKHYETVWSNQAEVMVWDQGPIEKFKSDFCVLKFAPTITRQMWTFATCGMSMPDDERPIELHLFSNDDDTSLVELLTAAAFYHQTESLLGLHHTINFGRPVAVGSQCEFGLLSLPYLDGPALENGVIPGYEVKFFWLIPITAREVSYKKTNGVEKLEQLFEEKGLNYLDPLRASLA